MRTVEFYIEEELPINYQDAGPWRSYHLEAAGNTYEELLTDAYIAEVDQDGGELNFYPLSEAGNAVYDAAERVLKGAIKC